MMRYMLLILLLLTSCTINNNRELPILPYIPASDDFKENITDLGRLYQYKSDDSEPITINKNGSIDYWNDGSPKIDVTLTFEKQISSTKAVYKQEEFLRSPSEPNDVYYTRYMGLSIVDGEIWVNRTTNTSYLKKIEDYFPEEIGKKAVQYRLAYAEEHINWGLIPDQRLFYKVDRSLDTSPAAIQKFSKEHQKTYELISVDRRSYVTNTYSATLAEDGSLTFFKYPSGTVKAIYDMKATRSLNTLGKGKEAYFLERKPPGVGDAFQIFIGIYEDYIYTFPATSDPESDPDSSRYNTRPRTFRKNLSWL